MTKRFKILTYNNAFINAGKLYNGLYGEAIPFLYEENETKETIIQSIEALNFLTDDELKIYRENLAKCELTLVELTKI